MRQTLQSGQVKHPHHCLSLWLRGESNFAVTVIYMPKQQFLDATR